MGLLFITQASGFLQRGIDTAGPYYFHIIVLLEVLLIAEIMRPEEFVVAYVKVMTFFAVCALALYILSLLEIYDFIPSLSIVNTSSYSYRHYLVGALYNRELGSLTSRAYGIFREPGAFAVCLCLGVGFELFMKKDPKLWIVLVLSAAVFITFSTAGYIALAFFVLSYIFGKKAKTRAQRAEKILIVFLCVMLLGLGLSDRIYNYVFGKLFTDNISLNSRWISLWGGLRLSLQRPLFGWGWKHITNNFVSAMAEYYGVAGVSFTNTYMRIACTYGWAFTLCVVWCSVRFFHRQLNQKKLTVFLFFIGWLMILSNEAFALNPLVYYVAFAGCKKYGNMEVLPGEST